MVFFICNLRLNVQTFKPSNLNKCTMINILSCCKRRYICFISHIGNEENVAYY